MASPSLDLANSIKVVMSNLKQLHPSNREGKRNAVYGLAAELGHALGKTLGAVNSEDLVGKLTEFWRANGLGDLKFRDTMPPTIELENCYDCVGWKADSETCGCAFKMVLLQTAFSDVVKSDVRMRQLACCTSGQGKCLFEVKGIGRGRA